MAVQAVNLTIEKGTDFENTFTLKNADGTPLDLNNYTAVAKLKKFPTATESTAFSVGITTATGQVKISMANTVTSSLDVGRHYYDVVRISSGSLKSKIVEGMILVNGSASV